MIEHEPCASLGNCYHIEAGRKGGLVGGKVRAGAFTPEYQSRVSKRAAEQHPDFLHQRAKLAGTSGWSEQRRNAQAKRMRLIGLTYGTTAGRIGGKKGGARCKELHPNLAVRRGKLGAKANHARPTWPEAIFYGLVYGNPVTMTGFRAQQDDGYGIYDGAWPTQHIVAELDGGGHQIFGDPKKDAMKDSNRRASGHIVIRETDENTLFLKALAIIGEGNQ